jgi:hypothetical protein
MLNVDLVVSVLCTVSAAGACVHAEGRQVPAVSFMLAVCS